MKRYKKNKTHLLILVLAVGFLLGIFYENINFRHQILPDDLFNKSNLQRYLQASIITEKYIWYVVKERVFSLIILCLFSCIKWKKTFVLSCLFLAGFFFGIFSAASVMQLGIKGILLCVAGLFPQIICYLISYSILFVYWFKYPSRNWNKPKTLFVTTAFLLGIIFETYLNPIVMKFIIPIV